MLRPASFAALALGLCAALSSATWSSPGQAHTLLMTPEPITDDDGAKVEPCGCVFGGTPACPTDYTTMTLTAGEPFDVTWVETINHSGSFRISVVPVGVEDVTAGMLDAAALPEIDDMNTTANATITETITVPNMPCEECTLQVRQFMEGSADPYYYTCASIRIVENGGGTGGASGTGGGGVGGEANGPGSGATSTGAGDDLGQGEGGAPTWQPEPLDEGCSTTGADPEAGWLVVLAALGLASSRRRRG